MSDTYGLECHPFGIRGLGSLAKRTAFVGVAPGKEEMRSGTPYSGQGGKLMTALLKAKGYDRQDFYFTNLVCWSNTKPTDDEVAACLPRLNQELDTLAPKLIIPFGKIPTAALAIPKHKGERGAVLWDANRHAYVMPTYEPAAILYSQSASMVGDMLRDFEKIDRILGWPEDGSEADVMYEVVYTPNRAQEVLDALPTDGTFVAVDIETSSADVEVLDIENDELLCIGISYAFPNGEGERNYVLRRSSLFSGLRWPTGVRWTFQYGQFDTYGIHRHLGVLLPIVEDTLLMSSVLDERPGHHKLKIQAREYCASGWYEESVSKQRSKNQMGSLPEATVDEYNAKDVAYTRRLATIHYPRLVADGMEPVYRNLLIPAANVFRDVQEYGIRIDLGKLEELWGEWSPRFDALEEELVEMASNEGFPGRINLASVPQLQTLFFKIMALEPLRFTPKGAPSTDKFFLDQLDHPFGAKMRARRTANTMLQYLVSILENLKPDGKIHPNPMLHNTATGRMAYQDPAAQTFPKEYTVGEDYARMRDIIVPDDDSYEIIEADYTQIEVWMCWAYTQDPNLYADLISGDVHTATAEGAFATTKDKWSPADWDVKRQNAKKIRFGLMYGEGAEKLSTPPPLGIGGSQADCQTFIDNYWKRYSVHRKKLIEWERTAMKEGELVSAFGRKRRFPLVLDHRQLRQAINFPIQSTSSDYNLSSAVELHPLLLELGARLLLAIHDSLVIQSPKAKRKEVCALIRSVMEKPRAPGFPSIKVDIKAGPTFLQTQKVKDY